MIDLSFLTEAEQEAILKVLNRDAELKKAEDERVKHLHDVVSDESEYKYKSGQWFYDAKSRRHRDKIHGAELVRASIRKRKKPATLAELSELNKDSSKRRWVNSVNQDLFIPPELYGVMEAPDEAEEDVMVKKQEGNQSSKKVSFSSSDKDQNKLKNGTLSPPKPRLNPFNSDGLQDEYKNEELSPNPENLMNGTGKPKSDIMSSLAKYGVKLPYPSPSKGTLNTTQARDEENSQKEDEQVPVPKPRKTLKMNGQPQDHSNSTLKRDDSFNGEEPLYSVVKKSPASSTQSQEKDFDLDDALMEPRFHGQRGKTQNIYLNEKPLEFGKSYSGGGKITYEPNYPSRKQKESDEFSPEELLPERSMITETSRRTMEDKPLATNQDDEPAESVVFWRRPIMEKQKPRKSSVDLPEEQSTSTHIVQDFPGVDNGGDRFGKCYPENLTSSKTAPGKDIRDAKSLFQNRLDAEHKSVGLTSNIPVVQNMSDSSKTDDKYFENQGRKDLPKSTHFKVMAFKDRMNEMPREQMSNPSQFQSLKHFWNVEEKNLHRETALTSPDKILAHVSRKNKPTRTDLRQSAEIPADEVMLPSTSDSLSEEEQTSQKVATWLATTPTVYGVGQMDPDEEKSYCGEEIVEPVQNSTLPKKSDDELANAIQKLRDEALEVPKKTEIEKSRAEEIRMMPQVNPYSTRLKQTTVAVSPISQKSVETKVPALDPTSSDSGFYKRVFQISNAQPPAKETVSVEPRSEPMENKDNLAPEKSVSGIRIRFGKRESSMPNEESVAEEEIEKSAVPKSRDQHDFIAALKRLEIEASKPPPLPDVEAEYEDKLLKEEIRQNAAIPVKSSMNFLNFGSASETNDLDTSTNHSVEFQMQHSYTPNKEPAIDNSSDLEETIEKSTVPSRKENEDLSIALKKLELEATEHQSDEENVAGVNQKVEFKKPERQVPLQTNLPESRSLNYSSSSNNGDNLEQPPKVFSYGLKPNPEAFDGQGKLPMAEEPPIESTRVESQENAADFHNRLLKLEEQAKTPEEPEDLLDDAVKVSQFPNQEVLVSKKVYSSMESMHSSVDGESGKAKEKELDSRSKPKDFSDLQSYHNEELANPLSPTTSGSYPENGNIQYKKSEVGSPEVSNSKPGMDESHPILSALKRSEAKTLNHKAVQEVSPTSTNPLNSSNPTEDTPAPAVNSFPQNAETLKRLSQSVPAFIHDETDGRDTDSASESSFQIGRHKKSPSSLTNLSGSSGMASMSSVSGSVMSIYSGDFGNIDIKGAIEFSIEYVEPLKEFLIYIYQCRDLAAAEVKKQRSDPYVKAYLLPEKAKMGKRKTAVKKKTLNPVYNEILRYKIPKQSLVANNLNLSVWHHDALGRNSFLGEVNVNLGTWDLSNTQRKWHQLEPRTPAAGVMLENRGEMKLSLKYVPHSPIAQGTKPSLTGEVYIWIKDCVQLPMLRENKINSFVKCTVLPDTSRKSRQKTRTVDKTPSPIFNHTMVYDGFKEEDLREACVELTVWDHNRLSNHFLGGLRIGLGTGKSYGTVVDWMDSTHEESVMWEKMMASPNTWIDGMLPLRMFKMAKLAK